MWPKAGHSASLEETQVVVLPSTLPQGWNEMTSKDVLCGTHGVSYDTALSHVGHVALCRCDACDGPGGVSSHLGRSSSPVNLQPRCGADGTCHLLIASPRSVLVFRTPLKSVPEVLLGNRKCRVAYFSPPS